MSSLRPAGRPGTVLRASRSSRLGGDRDPFGGGHGVAPERVGEVEAVHHRLHHPAGHELVQPHEGVVPGTDGVRGQRPGPLDRLGEGRGQGVGHLGRGLALDHGVGVVVDDRRDLGPGEDEEAHPVAAHLPGLRLGHEHHGQADRDVEVPGQLEQRPGGLGLVEGAELGRGGPLGLAEAAEPLLDLAQLHLQDADGVLVRAHWRLLRRGPVAGARQSAGPGRGRAGRG